MLTKFWGHPIYIGAIVLLPNGYNDHPNERYPVIYHQGHFGWTRRSGSAPRPASQRRAARAPR